MKTEILNVRLEPELAEALELHRKETDVPTSAFVRRALRMALYADAAPKIEKRTQPVLVPRRG